MKEFHIISLDSVDSTNSWAKSHITSFDPNKITLISAEEQTAGKGRNQKAWLSPKGNLYLTFYFQVPSSLLHLTSVGHIMILSLAELLEKKHLDVSLKWPNDLLLSQKKASGTLVELIFHKDIVHVILGIGINLNMEKSFLSHISQPATTLKEETKKFLDKNFFLDELTTIFLKNLHLFFEKGFSPFQKHFEKLLHLQGKTISLFDGEKNWTGKFHAVTEEGHLQLELSNHEIKTFFSGEIVSSEKL